MIARLTGKLLERRPDQAIVEAGGLGYRVFISLQSFYALPEPQAQVALLIHTVVREDALHLYGFMEQAEKDAFSHLISVSGVGPRLALGILSGITPAELWQAIRSRDDGRLTKIPGVGKKTAARLVVDLEGKLPKTEALPVEAISALPAQDPLTADAVSALMNLGYPGPAAQKAVDRALAALGHSPDDPAPDLSRLLRESLRSLSGGPK